MPHIAPVMMHFGRNNYLELFTHYLKVKSAHLYLSICHDLMMAVADSSLFRSCLLESGVLEEWVGYAVKKGEYDGRNRPEERIEALGFLVDAWFVKNDKEEDITDFA